MAVVAGRRTSLLLVDASSIGMADEAQIRQLEGQVLPTSQDGVHGTLGKKIVSTCLQARYSTRIWLTCTAYYIIPGRLEIRVSVLQMVPKVDQGMLIPNLGQSWLSGLGKEL